MGHLTPDRGSGDRVQDDRFMGVALALGERGRGRTSPNPNVGCVLVRDGRIVGRGWTQPGGRPHGEAMALAEAGDAARVATLYTTLEPCAHVSTRGPACADLLIAAGVARVVAAIEDPDPRTAGRGLARLVAAGIAVECGVRAGEARRAMAGFLMRQAQERPFVTLKLATSLDGCIATSAGASRWITGAQARAHVHLERSRHEAILVGRGTWEADAPALDVRLAGLEERSPLRVVLSASHPHPSVASLLPPSPGGRGIQAPSPTGRGVSGEQSPGLFRSCRGHDRPDTGPAAAGGGKGEGDPLWLPSPAAITTLPGDHLLVEGGAVTAAAFLRADLVDRLLLYRAPILIGGGPTLGDIGLPSLADAHGRWRLHDARALGSDRLEVYERG